MSYEKTTWKKGDVITAEKLNNIENGIEANETAIGQIDTSGGGVGSYVNVLGVHAVYSNGGSTITLDKTWQEINAAIRSGGIVYVYALPSDSAEDPRAYSGLVTKTETAGIPTRYQVDVYGGSNDIQHTYIGAAASGNPSWTDPSADE